jgi:hypothetical protein
MLGDDIAPAHGNQSAQVHLPEGPRRREVVCQYIDDEDDCSRRMERRVDGYP